MIQEANGVFHPTFRTYLLFIKNDLKNCIKNIRYRKKCRIRRATQRNVFFMYFDPQKQHPGIADRLKAIITTYNTAKANGYDYKIYFKTPFDLATYLTPQKDWETKEGELEYSVIDTKIVNETNFHPIRKLKQGKQYHCYQYAGNVMPRFFEDTGYKWCDLFHELFSPSHILESAYKSLDIQPKTYISIHLRFVNALESFENTYFNNHIESSAKRNELIKRCKEGIQEIQHLHPNKPIYVFSDSKIFLECCSDLNVKILPSDHIGHTGSKDSSDTYLKTFLDLYVMSKSQAIYRVCAPELYSISHFALLAATIGDIPFYDQTV